MSFRRGENAPEHGELPIFRMLNHKRKVRTILNYIIEHKNKVTI